MVTKQVYIYTVGMFEYCDQNYRVVYLWLMFFLEWQFPPLFISGKKQLHNAAQATYTALVGNF